MKFQMVLLSVIISSLAMGQGKYDANWCLGVKAGIDFNDTAHPINFNTFANSTISTASISDSSGHLLFYCAPDTPFHYYSIYGGIFEAIFDVNNSVIRNGDSIFHGYGISGEIFIPVPSKPNEFIFFYLPTFFSFSTDSFGNPVTTEYSNLYSTHIIKDSLGYKVVQKNQLLSNDKLERGLALTKHANGKDWWLLVHDCNLQQTSHATNRYYRYLITSDSILGPFYQDIGTSHFTYYSYLSTFNFSRSGNKFASGLQDQLIGELYDFNRCTGELSNCSVITNLNTPGYGEVSSCVFSPDETKIYFSKGYGNTNYLDNAIIQYSVDSTNLNSTKVLLFDSTTSAFSFGDMRLAPDNKIYLAVDKNNIKPYADNDYGIYNQYLWRINNPDSSGTACNFQPLAYYLGDSARVYWGLPNMPNYNLGPMSIYQAGVSKDTFICNSDTVGITIGGPAISGVIYNWQGINISDPTLAQQTVNPTQSSWYYVTLTDTTIRYSCQSRTDSIFVEVRQCCDTAAFALAGAGKDTSFCREDTTVTGVPIGVVANGISYIWQQGPGIGNVHSASQTVLPDASRWYIVSITDSSGYCGSKNDSVFVQVKSCCDTSLLSHVSAGADTSICKDSTSVLIGSLSLTGIAYYWYPSIGLNDSAVAEPIAKPDSNTYYVLTAKDTSVRNLVCPAKTDTVLVRVEKCDTTGIDEVLQQQVKVYPNPSSYELIIETPAANHLVFKLYDVIGHIMIETHLSSSKTQLNISGIAQGIYFYNIGMQSGKIQVLR